MLAAALLTEVLFERCDRGLQVTVQGFGGRLWAFRDPKP